MERAISEKKRAEESEEGEVEGTRLTVLDMEDAWEAEAKLFTPASRVTEADEQNDLQSPERHLDQSLVLLVKQKLGNQTHWVFPQGPRQEGESMRQAAERVLSDNCGNSVKASFLGNAPCGFLQYRFPPNAGIGTGAKVFFFKAWYKDGDVVPNEKDTSDYKWVKMDELSDYCSRSYLQNVRDFLVDL
nr:hypothetical protein BaRGS_012615 [Batillaria attramentaria]